MQTITINFDEVPATPVDYKYDLMHLNTPSYASTLIEWDTGKMGKVTRNRILKWLKGGIQTYHSGEAAAMYRELVQHLKIPRIVIGHNLLNPLKDKNSTVSHVALNSPPDYLIDALDEVYQASRVLAKMQGISPYWFNHETVRDIMNAQTHRFFQSVDLMIGVPMDGVVAAVDRMASSDEYQSKVADAVAFVEQGKKLYFRY